MLKENPDMKPSFETMAYENNDLYNIESAADLEQAGNLLVEMGFEKLKK